MLHKIIIIKQQNNHIKPNHKFSTMTTTLLRTISIVISRIPCVQHTAKSKHPTMHCRCSVWFRYSINVQLLAFNLYKTRSSINFSSFCHKQKDLQPFHGTEMKIGMFKEIIHFSSSSTYTVRMQ